MLKSILVVLLHEFFWRSSVRSSVSSSVRSSVSYGIMGNFKVNFLSQCSCYLGQQHIDYRCYVQTGSSSEHNEKPLTNSLTSENGGETDLVKENQKIKGKARYSIKDLLKQVCFLHFYISLQKHVFPSLTLYDYS